MSKIGDLLVNLASCVCAQIAEDESPEPCWCGVMPGNAALLDYVYDCEDGGLAWTRLMQSYPSTTVGQQDTRTNNCGSGVGVDIEVGILRPYPVTTEAPDEALSLEITEQQIKDMTTMRRAIRCCAAIDPHDLILGTYQPLPVGGAAYGGIWTVYVALP